MHALADPLGDLDRHLPRGAGHHDGELFTAVASADVENPHATAKQVGDVAERAIAFEVAERIVDALEVVDVHHQQREVLLLAPRALDLGLEARLEISPVEESGDRIDGCDPRQLVEALADALTRECQRGRSGQQPHGREIAIVEGPSIGAVRQCDDGDGSAVNERFGIADAPGTLAVTATLTNEDAEPSCTVSGTVNFEIRQATAPIVSNLRKPPPFKGHRGWLWDSKYWFWVKPGPTGNVAPITVEARAIRRARVPGPAVPAKRITFPMRVSDGEPPDQEPHGGCGFTATAYFPRCV